MLHLLAHYLLMLNSFQHGLRTFIYGVMSQNFTYVLNIYPTSGYIPPSIFFYTESLDSFSKLQITAARAFHIKESPGEWMV